ncbi:hypothetical protein E4T43_04196 [Aureobasidium subglaciale]|nr:hypothetical protein E4T43_04196 [Aureobasidium subglaciale]
MALYWADATRTDKYCSSRAEEQGTISTIQDLLNDTTTPGSAALAIASTYEPCLLAGEKVSWYLFSLLSRAIVYLTTILEDQRRVVEMLVHLAQLPDVVTDDEPVEQNGRVYWRDMPEFNMHTVESIDEGQVQISWLEQAARFELANRFCAILLDRFDTNIAPKVVRVIQLALDDIQDALEVVVESSAQIRRAGIYIPAAAQYFTHASPQLWGSCKRRERYQGEKIWKKWLGQSDGSGSTWLRDEGCSVEKWRFWREQLVEALELERGGGRVMDHIVDCSRRAVKARYGRC